jgi:P2 family phage contractile tail tube protein
MSAIEFKGPVSANTIYSGNELCAKDSSVQLPAVTPITADYVAMGTMNLPVIGNIESMEMTITKIGTDVNLGKLVRPEKQDIEVRWVQESVGNDGSTKLEGCKAFLRAIPKGIPGLTTEIGSAMENEITYEVTRYQLFVNGKELFLIDRLSQILRVNGVDYYAKIRSLL